MAAGVKELEAQGASFFKMRYLHIPVKQENDHFIK